MDGLYQMAGMAVPIRKFYRYVFEAEDINRYRQHIKRKMILARDNLKRLLWAHVCPLLAGNGQADGAPNTGKIFGVSSPGQLSTSTTGRIE